ncbi:MAG: hypothetical protein ACR2NN_12160 [Bryobacteraceae bacterium]
MRKLVVTGLCFAAFTASAFAAPKLRLAQTVVGPVTIAQGSNGAVQSIDARNASDGNLNLQVSSSVPWLAPSLGAPHNCADGTSGCTPVQIALQTASLAKGSYTGFITVTDPNAIDAPQTIAVTVQIGGVVPGKLDYFLPPGGIASTSFTTAGPATVNATTQSGGTWLSVAQDGTGTFFFNVPFKVTVAAGSLAPSDYNGTVTVAGSSLASDNKSIPVTLHVTTQPIAQAATSPVVFRAAQGGGKQNLTVPVTNSGQGTLTISGVTTSTTSGGSFLTAQAGTTGSTIVLTADPTGLTPGTYSGTAVVASNGANSALSVPVELDVLAPSGPIAKAGGVVNNATFMAGESVAQGDIVALFGDQLISGDPASALTLPLSSTLGGAQVFVNDQPAPVYFVSAGQINFQIPFDAALGEGTVRVERNGQRGNIVSVTIARSVPRLLRLTIGDYGIITNQDQSFPIPATPGLSSHPAKVGDVLTIYALGLGPTSPAVASGVASPAAEPLARVVTNPKVCFGTPTPFNQANCVTPQFAGLSPNFVGLYQINVQIPAGVPTGDTLPLRLTTDDGDSNPVQIAVK